MNDCKYGERGQMYVELALFLFEVFVMENKEESGREYMK